MKRPFESIHHIIPFLYLARFGSGFEFGGNRGKFLGREICRAAFNGMSLSSHGFHIPIGQSLTDHGDLFTHILNETD